MKKRMRGFWDEVARARERMFRHQYRLENHPSARRRHLLLVASDRWDKAVDRAHKAQRRFERKGANR